MGYVEEKLKPAGLINGTNTLLEEMKILKEMQDISGLSVYQCCILLLNLFIYLPD